MPRSVLQVVAVLILACAVGGFVLGLRGAPDRGRLPGEGPDATPGQAIQAPDAELLETDERPPPPPEKTEEELRAEAEQAAEEKARAEAAAAEKLAQAEAEKAARPPPKITPPPQPEPDRVGDLIDGLTPNDIPPY
ncbi:MAG: hypothetical protein ACK41C_05240 [Phenylobacterium sp.]|uniref:hypothetical protein n=1 Tax=Phenylobacterium sp. TaxID=1871053 RepID=UPI00391B7CEC